MPKRMVDAETQKQGTYLQTYSGFGKGGGEVKITANIHNEQGVLLVAKGETLTDGSVEKIIQHKLRRPLEESIGLEPLLNPKSLVESFEVMLQANPDVALVFHGVDSAQYLLPSLMSIQKQQVIFQKLTVLASGRLATTVVVTGAGHEQRNVDWAEARGRWDVASGLKNQAQLDELIAFFRARKGKAYGFRFKDWTAYKASGQLIGTGDGSTKTFQLVKHYPSGSIIEVRTVAKPVAGTVHVYKDGVEQPSGWSVDVTTGVVTFTTAPIAGVAITADFELDVPVRFDTDHMAVTIESFKLHRWQQIPIVELRT